MKYTEILLQPNAAAKSVMAPDPIDTGDTAWLLAAAALVSLMVPSLAIFYGGLVSNKAVVNTMVLTLISFSTVSVVWSLIGYSLAFGPNEGAADGWMGGGSFGAFDSSDKARAGTSVPEHAYFIFQLMFATITAAVVSGAVVQRITLWAWALFSAIWVLLVYVPLARWVFYSNGWLLQWGVLDFAGGLVVETASGVSAFVLAHLLGHGRVPHGAAHNVPLVLLGMGLLWFGWYGFNAGSAIAAGYSASRAFANTHLAACAGMAAWVLLEAAVPKFSRTAVIRGGWRCACARAGGRPAAPPDADGAHGAAVAPWSRSSQAAAKVPWGNPSAIGMASGALAGLVAITPAAGFVSQMAALLIGAITAPIAFAAARALKSVRVDDRLECLPIHGVAGAVGVLLTGLFAAEREGAPSDGLFYGNPVQLGKQLAGLVITILVASVGTAASFGIVRGVGMLLHAPVRVHEAAEEDIDASVHGEQAYEYLGGRSSAMSAGLTLMRHGGSGSGGRTAPLLPATERGSPLLEAGAGGATGARAEKLRLGGGYGSTNSLADSHADGVGLSPKFPPSARAAAPLPHIAVPTLAGAARGGPSGVTPTTGSGAVSATSSLGADVAADDAAGLSLRGGESARGGTAQRGPPSRAERVAQSIR